MYLNFSSEKFSFLVVKFSIYLNRRVFVGKDTTMQHTTILVFKVSCNKQSFV